MNTETGRYVTVFWVAATRKASHWKTSHARPRYGTTGRESGSRLP